ncbi:ATP-binding protein [Paracoccus liaowanqingii]|nr:ATP-binding protein [Paracoccus liaowanqingii]
MTGETDPLSVEPIWIERDLGEVSRASEAVKNRLEGELTQEQAEAVDLALTEALTNTIRHGTVQSAIQIGIYVQTGPGFVAVEIADSSPPMPQYLLDEAGADKLEVDPDNLASLSEGGRGLSLIVMLMDEVAYVRVDGEVRLRMLLRTRNGSL